MKSIFKKIGSPATLSQEVEKKIEEAILQKKLGVGKKLPTETELCEMFAVSRTTLREALRMLVARGLIRIRKGDGIYVNDYSHDHVWKAIQLFLELNYDPGYLLHIIHLRQMIEPGAARMAAKNRTEEDMREFEHIISVMKKETDATKLAQLDLEFHLKILDAGGNPLIMLTMEPIYQLLSRIKIAIIKKVKSTNQFTALEYHIKIYETIKTQDENGAHTTMTGHLRIAERDAHLYLEDM